MFNTMVKSICMYAVEIWDIEERKEIESIQERYMKNILGLERCTPGCMLREETKTERIMVEAGGRVIKYEGKMDRNEIRESKGKLIHKSWDEQMGGRRER